jgi:hypothetical protein
MKWFKRKNKGSSGRKPMAAALDVRRGWSLQGRYDAAQHTAEYAGTGSMPMGSVHRRR